MKKLPRRRAFGRQRSRAHAAFTDLRARARQREHTCGRTPREPGTKGGWQREAALLITVPRSIGSPVSPLLEASISSTQTESIFEGIF